MANKIDVDQVVLGDDGVRASCERAVDALPSSAVDEHSSACVTKRRMSACWKALTGFEEGELNTSVFAPDSVMGRLHVIDRAILKLEQRYAELLRIPHDPELLERMLRLEQLRDPVSSLQNGERAHEVRLKQLEDDSLKQGSAGDLLARVERIEKDPMFKDHRDLLNELLADVAKVQGEVRDLGRIVHPEQQVTVKPIKVGTDPKRRKTWQDTRRVASERRVDVPTPGPTKSFTVKRSPKKAAKKRAKR